MGEMQSRRWQKLRLEVLARDNRECGVPGCEVIATTVDHIHARSRGGAMWDKANLISMCAHHNYSKGSRMENEVRREWFELDWFEGIELSDLK